ncbi:hypothetical protein [Paraburkholderia sp. C35]|nr:hypothetical protein [Paraburkholderia sp. C35]
MYSIRVSGQKPDHENVSGLVYDVATGKVEVVVPPGPLREEA